MVKFLGWCVRETGVKGLACGEGRGVTTGLCHHPRHLLLLRVGLAGKERMHTVLELMLRCHVKVLVRGARVLAHSTGTLAAGAITPAATRAMAVRC